MKAFLTALLIGFISPLALSDVVYLKGGATFEGRVHDKGNFVQIEMVKGKVTINKASIDRIEKKPYILDTYESRLAKTSAEDVREVLDLARWCDANGLDEFARKHYGMVLSLVPDHKEAFRYLTGTQAETAPQEKTKEFEELYRERLAAMDSQRATDHYRVALWCREQGQEAFARKHLGQAISLDPKFKQAIEALKGGRAAPVQAEIGQGKEDEYVPEITQTKDEQAIQEKEVIPGWWVHSGNWRVEKGVLVAEPDCVPGMCEIFTADRSIADFALSGRFWVKEGNPDISCGPRILFRVLSPSESSGGYQASWKAGQSNFIDANLHMRPIGWPNNMDYRILARDRAYAAPLSQWHNFLLTVTDTRLVLRCDDMILESRDGTHRSGMVGFRFCSCAGKIADLNLKVTRREAPDPSRLADQPKEQAKPSAGASPSAASVDAKQDQKEGSLWGKALQDVVIDENGEITMRVRGIKGDRFAVLPFKEGFRNFSLRFMVKVQRLDPGVFLRLRFRSNISEGKDIGYDDFHEWQYNGSTHSVMNYRRGARYSPLSDHDLTLPLGEWIPIEFRVRNDIVELFLAKKRVISTRLTDQTLKGAGIYFALHTNEPNAEAEVRLKDVSIVPLK